MSAMDKTPSTSPYLSPSPSPSPSSASSFESDSEAPPAYSEDPKDLPSEDNAIVEASLKWIPPPSNLSQSYPPLAQPVAIPQIDVGKGMGPPLPFLRAYSPSLAAHDISVKDFVAFIDNLAVAMAPPAPFQALQMGSMVTGMVPNHIAHLVSMGVGAAAGAGSAGFVMARTKKYFERVNREFFHPRGLDVHLKKDGELCGVLSLSGARLQEVNAATHNRPISDMTPLRDRRLQALQPYIAPLTFDVPPQTEQTNVLDKLSAKQTEMKLAKQQHKDQKHAEKRQRKAEKHARKDAKHHRHDYGNGYGNEYLSPQQNGNGYLNMGQDYKGREKDVRKLEKLKWIVVQNYDVAKDRTE